MSEAIRIYLTGACEGFEKLREALAQQPGIEIVGYAEQAGGASGRARRAAISTASCSRRARRRCRRTRSRRSASTRASRCC